MLRFDGKQQEFGISCDGAVIFGGSAADFPVFLQLPIHRIADNQICRGYELIFQYSVQYRLCHKTAADDAEFKFIQNYAPFYLTYNAV